MKTCTVKSRSMCSISDLIAGSLLFFFIFSNVVGVYILQFHKKIYIAAFTSVLQLPRS